VKSVAVAQVAGSEPELQDLFVAVARASPTVAVAGVNHSEPSDAAATVRSRPVLSDKSATRSANEPSAVTGIR
jgi:hypothetical protein